MTKIPLQSDMAARVAPLDQHGAAELREECKRLREKLIFIVEKMKGLIGIPKDERSFVEIWFESQDEIESLRAKLDEARKTPDEWCRLLHIQISDPDGWRSKGDPPWKQPLDYDDFMARAIRSTQLLSANPVLLRSELNDLRAQLAESQEDTELLDWMQENGMMVDYKPVAQRHQDFWRIENSIGELLGSGDTIRAALDNARREGCNDG